MCIRDRYNTDAETIYAVIEEEALATYTTAVAQCDVADETGVSGEVDAYVNGQETTVDINENATKATIGEQGRLTEVYEDCVVMIDTFLAQVTDVVSSETDGNGHLDRQALLELNVYTTYGQNPQTVYLTSDTDYTLSLIHSSAPSGCGRGAPRWWSRTARPGPLPCPAGPGGSGP